jgi:osmotically-inducible protein OsmY
MESHGLTRMIALLIAASALSACALLPSRSSATRAVDRGTSLAVEKVLRQYPSLQGANSVRVQTMNGVVYLYGQVATDLERLSAEQAALSVNGVARVVNSIGVEYGGG